jgi:hypothetical protein
MEFFRSTLKGGASWHACTSWQDWPVIENRHFWSPPTDNQPGEWREAQPNTPIIPHGNGLHGAGFQALAYWFGPENYIIESDDSALRPEDWRPSEQEEDILVCRRGRLIRRLIEAPQMWEKIALQCAGLLTEFPRYYNYEGRYDERAEDEAAFHPKYKIFQNAKMAYEWREAIEEASAILLYKEKIDNRDSTKKRIHLIDVQKGAHYTSLERCVEYNDHSDAMIHGMGAIHELGKILTLHESENPEHPYSIVRQIVTHTAQAYKATGAEQMRLMMTGQYTMDDGLGPLLKDLPFLNERQLDITSAGHCAGRAAMLKMSEFVAEGLGLSVQYQNSMKDHIPLESVMAQLAKHHAGFKLDPNQL